MLSNELLKKEMLANDKPLPVGDGKFLVKRTISVSKAGLESYIETINKLKMDGVNVPTILDHMFISETEGENAPSANGVLFEEIAREEESYKKRIGMDIASGDAPRDVLNNFINNTETYVSSIESKAEEDDKTYEKFIDDYMKIYASGLAIDSKTNSFHYQKGKGFSFVGLKPNSETINAESVKNYIPLYMINAVYGAGRPVFEDEKIRDLIPNYYYKRLNEASTKLNERLKGILSSRGIPQECIDMSFKQLESLIQGRPVSDPNIIFGMLREIYEEKIQKNRNSKNEDGEAR